MKQNLPVPVVIGVIAVVLILVVMFVMKRTSKEYGYTTKEDAMRMQMEARKSGGHPTGGGSTTAPAPKP